MCDTVKINRVPPFVTYFPNGMKFAHYQVPFENTCYVQIILKAGALNQEPKDIGYAHFLEHLISFYPSEEHPNSLENQQWINDNSIMMNAWTKDDSCGYWMEGMDSYLEDILDLMICNQMHPKLDDAEVFKKEQGAVVRELRSYIDDEWYPLDTLIHKTLYGSTNLARSVEEELKNVKELTEKNFTKRFQTFFKKFYVPNYMVLTVVSPRDPRTVHKYLMTKYSDYFNKKSKLNTPNIPEYPIPTMGPCGTYFAKTNTHEYKIVYAFPLKFTFFDDVKYYTDAIVTILTGGLSNRLLKRLRSKMGAVYGVHCTLELDPHTKEYSFINIETMTGGKRVVEVVEAINDELEKFRNLTKGEIKQLLNKSKFEHSLMKHTVTLKDSLSIYDHHVTWDEPFIKDGRLIHSIETDYQKKINVCKDPEMISNVAKHIFKTCYLFYGGPKEIKFKTL